jgi:phospholipase/carboxylesterase
MANNQRLPHIEINPPSPAEKCVIWLHGLGADGGDFAPIVPELHLPQQMNVRFVFPHAPSMPVTINNGYVMPAWFDIYSSDISSRADVIGIKRSIAQINTLIQHEEENGIAAENILLAGFSQGAVIALTTGLLYPKRLAGVMALSGLFPHADSIIKRCPPTNHDLPILIAHGTEDQILPIHLGRAAFESLEKARFPVTWHSYAMGHSVCGEEIKDISHWMQKIWA